MKPALLFLCHRIPYPPNKGDKIRSWHLLRHFSQHYRLYLGAFVDDPADWEHSELLEDLCEETFLLPLHPALARMKSLRGLISGQALTIPYYFDNRMQAWVNSTVKVNQIERLMAYSSSMAQYALRIDHQFVKKMIDFVDIDSDKWLQYSENKPWPMSWLYRRESRKLHDFEREVAGYFDASLFVSSAEARLFQQMIPSAIQKIDYFNNGVDTGYFSPLSGRDNPYSQAEVVLVFTGAMDYWPNVDAVNWFVTEVFPALRSRFPQLCFYIVGSNPKPVVQKLAEQPGVHVTGTVKDIRPYLQYALAAVAPMRIARGVQNKVLEAMAMARPVIVTSMALEGIEAQSGSEVLLANQLEEFVAHIAALLEGTLGLEIGRASREHVVSNFSWADNLSSIETLMETGIRQPGRVING